MKVVKLGEACEFNPPKKQVREKLKTSDLVSFLPMQDLPIGTKDCSTNSTKTLEEVIKQYTFFANDDLLVAKITPCFENGKMSIARDLKNGFGFVYKFHRFYNWTDGCIALNNKEMDEIYNSVNSKTIVIIKP